MIHHGVKIWGKSLQVKYSAILQECQQHFTDKADQLKDDIEGM